MIEFKKPNLIPNNGKEMGNEAVYEYLANSDSNLVDYYIFPKKDGCRMEGTMEGNKTRSMKPINSELVNERFDFITTLANNIGCVIEGEFYAHGMKFNEIFRFFSNTDVTRFSVKKKLEKEFVISPEQFSKDHNGRSVEWLTKFHSDLKFWIFDVYFPEQPNLTYEDRMVLFGSLLESYLNENKSIDNQFERYIDISDRIKAKDVDDLKIKYQAALDDGYEGLVLQHKDHIYKQGRNTIKEGHLLKLKDDLCEYDGVVIEVVESTVVKDGVEKTINEVGRSVTSKKKDDREASGMAKGLVTKYNGTTHTVSLNGFTDEQKRELWVNRHLYVGRHFKYTGMPPVKDAPRSAFFDCWRDEK